jgi:hypothetical protein
VPEAAILRRQAEAKPSAAPAETRPAPAAEAFAQDQLDEHVARDAAAAATASAETEAAAGLARDNAQPLREAAKTANAAAPVMQAEPAAPPPAAPASRADTGAAASGYVDSASALGGQDRERKEESALAKKPATWLVEIRRLRDQGHVEEARARLVEFHKTYPKWVIPTDLAPLLSE